MKNRDTQMSVIIKQVAKERSDIPKVAIGILAAIFVLSMFVAGYDQGQLVQALAAPMGIHLNHDQLMWIHEFNHDLRHAAGFPCH
jgi:Probable cobalt transporter subunit (CbtB)